MYSYELLQDFEGGTAGYVSTTPRAVVAVWRYARPVTFDRAAQQSVPGDGEVTRLRRQGLLLIYEDIASIVVNSSKNSHLLTTGIELRAGSNYLNEILAGDWIGVWIVNSQGAVDSLMKRLQKGDSCNQFGSGLKFIGKAHSIRKRINQSPAGMRTVRFSVQGVGFSELDAQQYYEPFLQNIAPGPVSEILGKTGAQVNKFISKSGDIKSSDALAFFFKVFLGGQIPPNQGFDTPLRITAGLDNRNVFRLPSPVAKVFGLKEDAKWAELARLIVGVQKYDSGGTEAVRRELQFESNVPRAALGLNPTGIVIGNNLNKLPIDLIGTFLPSVPQFNGSKSVWTYMTQFLNPAVNEMYVTLKPDNSTEGNLFPTIVARQLPFTSADFNTTFQPKVYTYGKKGIEFLKPDTRFGPREIPVTRFLELPRWKASPVLVKNLDVGRTDGQRFNFVKIVAESGTNTSNKTQQIVRDPPILDQTDIVRNGLRPYNLTVNCAEQESNGRRAGDWQYLVSDFIIGSHMYLNGTVQLVGIQAPICIGDNFEVDDHVFHIESVTHQFQSDENGNTSFSTGLSLTYGQTTVPTRYSGAEQTDFTQYDPATTRAYYKTEEVRTNFQNEREDANVYSDGGGISDSVSISNGPPEPELGRAQRLDDLTEE
jgi:hypothetical protein